MVYKNFFLRLIFSLLFMFIYFAIILININYLFFLILFIYIFIIYEIFFYFKKYKFIPIIYTLVSFCFFLQINFDKNILITFNLFIFIVISFDISSYFIGKYSGKNQLIKISPNKTIEGFLGGIIFSLLSSIFYSYIFEIKINLKLIIFIFLIIMFAFIGDIIESYFKRKNNLKNSSEFIPGHGGVFDRFDSFLFSINFYSIFYYYFI